MCSLFGLIDFKGVLNTHMKNKILNTLARECQVRGTDATGIAYNFNDRLRIRSLVMLTAVLLPSPTTAFSGTIRNSALWKIFPRRA